MAGGAGGGAGKGGFSLAIAIPTEVLQKLVAFFCCCGSGCVAVWMMHDDMVDALAPPTPEPTFATSPHNPVGHTVFYSFYFGNDGLVCALLTGIQAPVKLEVEELAKIMDEEGKSGDDLVIIDVRGSDYKGGARPRCAWLCGRVACVSIRPLFSLRHHHPPPHLSRTPTHKPTNTRRLHLRILCVRCVT